MSSDDGIAVGNRLVLVPLDDQRSCLNNFFCECLSLQFTGYQDVGSFNAICPDLQVISAARLCAEVLGTILAGFSEADTVSIADKFVDSQRLGPILRGCRVNRFGVLGGIEFDCSFGTRRRQ